MKVPVFVWQFDNAYPGLIGDDDALAGMISKVIGKTHDGLSWQGRWDTHAAAIKSNASVAHADRDIYAPQGISYDPWCVVNGRWPGQTGVALAEGRMAGEVAIAAAAGDESRAIVLDLEPHEPAAAGGANYWRDDLGAGDVDVDDFCYAFSQAIGTPPDQPNGGRIDLCVDARPGRIEPVRFSHWCGKSEVRRCYPQVYSSSFHGGAPTIAEAEHDLDVMIGTLASNGWTNAATVWPALAGDCSPDVIVAQIAKAKALGCGGVAIWQRAILRADTAAAIGALDDPWAYVPPPPAPAPAARDVLIGQLEAALATARTL